MAARPSFPARSAGQSLGMVSPNSCRSGQQLLSSHRKTMPPSAGFSVAFLGRLPRHCLFISSLASGCRPAINFWGDALAHSWEPAEVGRGLYSPEPLLQAENTSALRSPLQPPRPGSMPRAPPCSQLPDCVTSRPEFQDPQLYANTLLCSADFELETGHVCSQGADRKQMAPPNRGH